MTVHVSSLPRLTWHGLVACSVPWHTVARLLGQALVLASASLVSEAVVRRTGLPVPSNLLGLLLLLGLLASGRVRPDQLAEVGGFAQRHLAFCFVPFVVGLVAYGPLLAGAGPALLGSLIAALVLGLAAAGLTAQAVARRVR